MRRIHHPPQLRLCTCTLGIPRTPMQMGAPKCACTHMHPPRTPMRKSAQPIWVSWLFVWPSAAAASALAATATSASILLRAISSRSRAVTLPRHRFQRRRRSWPSLVRRHRSRRSRARVGEGVRLSEFPQLKTLAQTVMTVLGLGLVPGETVLVPGSG